MRKHIEENPINLRIENVTTDGRSDNVPNDFAIRSDHEIPLAHFRHTPLEGPAMCLRRAADTLDEAEQAAHYASHMPHNL